MGPNKIVKLLTGDSLKDGKQASVDYVSTHCKTTKKHHLKQGGHSMRQISCEVSLWHSHVYCGIGGLH